MINTVYNVLTPLGLPILHLLRPDISGENKTGISYHFFNEGYTIRGDGKGKNFGGSLQVDIFSKTDYSETIRQVRELLEARGFRLADSRDSEDSLGTSVQYYQKILIFNYIESEVRDGS